MTAARELVIADEPGAWEQLRFAPAADGYEALTEAYQDVQREQARLDKALG